MDRKSSVRFALPPNSASLLLDLLLDQGYRLHGSPAVTFNGTDVRRAGTGCGIESG